MSDRPGFDPTQDVRLDAAGLRALAHPLRVRMLSRLRSYGPATPSMLARDLGESSGATSYHLRQLLAHGFVVEDTERGTRRERWYRSAHRSTHFDLHLDDETRAYGGEYLRAVARAYAERMLRYTDSVETLEDGYGPEWREVWDLSDVKLDLSPDDARALTTELGGVLARFRERSRPGAHGARAVVAQIQVMPLPETP